MEPMKHSLPQQWNRLAASVWAVSSELTSNNSSPIQNRFISGLDSVQSGEKKTFLVQRVAATIAPEHRSV